MLCESRDILVFCELSEIFNVKFNFDESLKTNFVVRYTTWKPHTTCEATGSPTPTTPLAPAKDGLFVSHCTNRGGPSVKTMP